MCWYSDDGGAEVWNARTVTARKPHRCDGCTVSIQPGERYHYVFFVYEGDAMTWHVCLPCVEASKRLGRACRLYDSESGDAPWDSLRWELPEHLADDSEVLAVAPPELVEALRADLTALNQRLALATRASSTDGDT